jgi:hypothetical protein
MAESSSPSPKKLVQGSSHWDDRLLAHALIDDATVAIAR